METGVPDVIDLRSGIGTIGGQLGDAWRPETTGDIGLEYEIVGGIVGRTEAAGETGKGLWGWDDDDYPRKIFNTFSKRKSKAIQLAI